MGGVFGTTLDDLQWVDEFIANVRPYVRVRLEDNVLIKVPLDVHPLNKTGAALFHRALEGETIRQIASSFNCDKHPERIAQIHEFFCDVRDLLSERLGDGRDRRATRVSAFEGSFTKYPVLSEMALTYGCNLSCRFCYAGCSRDLKPIRDTLTTEEILRCIDSIALDAKVPSISFTGGEPTLHADLPQFIKRAKERKMRVNLITNGIKCADEDFVKGLVDAGLDSAQVSLEGPTAEIHESLTGVRGSFERTIQGIRNLKSSGLRVHTNTTICRENIDSLNGIVDLAKSIELPRLSMNMMIPTDSLPVERIRSLQVRYSEIGEHVLRTRDYAESQGVRFPSWKPSERFVLLLLRRFAD